MATSGTYAYNPALGTLTLYAFNQAGVRNTAITQEHMETAHMGANLVLADWANKGVNLWQVELITTPLVTGTSTYDVDPNTVVILDAYVTVDDGSQEIDRILLPISRSEWASYPNKSQSGFPTVYWMDRLLAPTVTLWPVPDGQQVSLKYYALRQAQDANFTSGQTVEIPYLWMMAFAYGLARELAVIWNPERLQFLAPMADKAYQAAALANEETAQFYISPMTSGYYRA